MHKACYYTDSALLKVCKKYIYRIYIYNNEFLVVNKLLPSCTKFLVSVWSIVKGVLQ